MTFNEIYSTYLNYSQEEKIALAKGATVELLKFFQKVGLTEDNPELVQSFFHTLLSLFIGADGKITSHEAAIYNEIFGTNYSPSEMVGFVGEIIKEKDNFIDIDAFIDQMNQEQKALCCYIILAIITADGNVTAEESAAFERILD